MFIKLNWFFYMVLYGPNFSLMYLIHLFLYAGGGCLLYFICKLLRTDSMLKGLEVYTKNYYKITKIVRALWLAERSVCMRVCKHGCGVKMFCFSRANHPSTNLKKVLSWKARQVYFIHPFPCRLKLRKSLETCCVNFLSLELTF